jgi:hypothetical protein
MNTEERFPYLMEIFKQVSYRPAASAQAWLPHSKVPNAFLPQAVRCLVGYFTKGYSLNGQRPNDNAKVLAETFRSWTRDAFAFDTLRKLSELIGASGSAAFGAGTQSLYRDVTRASASVRAWDSSNPGHVKVHSNVVALGLLAKKMPVLVDTPGYTTNGPIADKRGKYGPCRRSCC